MYTTTNAPPFLAGRERGNMRQKFTSRGTSVNTRKIPAIFSKIDCSQSIFDWGCGKAPEIIRAHVKSHGGTYYGYDPYNSVGTFPNGKVFDLVTFSNVLNVIAEDEIVLEEVRAALALAPTVAIAVYEGNRSGVGRQSKADCYQRNQPLGWYKEFFDKIGEFKTKIKCGVLYITL